MLEETLRAEAQVLRDMLSTHDTDDFMRRLFARIDQTPTRGQRVQSAPPDAFTAPPSFDSQTHRSTRPAIRRGVRRRPLPFVTSDPADRPSASLNHVRRLCETVLGGEEALTRIKAFDDTYDATGACAFACLLFVYGRKDSALYWWRFAAGADDALSAHVLAVYHAATGPVTSARAWCAYSRHLGYTAARHLPEPLRMSAAPITWEPAARTAVGQDLAKNFMTQERLPEALARH
ncbi:hypothetical protein [Streptomyces nitrosporeus]|uniref:hypothetical protein n=1 Tax=Streptomyces nitrosporeus TaxID=28894 RepID=UPI00167D430A|nr:hypothetical protein [Streptomyces nitrosporeus]GGZ20085.1 hypothetical protein GCM10010327_59110 [Streptomyces nitrosporeus]